MRKLFTTSLIIFWIIVILLIIGGVFSVPQKDTKQPEVQPTQTQTFDIAEVGKHNKESDCWLVVENKIYDVSQYIFSHPGGRGSIVKFCGSDATRFFVLNTEKGYKHSSYANNLLRDYYIADFQN